ncbi:putative transmembrane protein [Toxoplasma gondii TgCatPRC2]|uniref:Transmembrane protein n=9 Tax=Toxoplasma gondii TaxID=5811 RepID=A0A125YHS7_TOXGV|nr:hypothetical protein TGME49_294240 [Toxoplasma gondii ME49]EPR57580.1 hypothetical protein TGGT1_294240 [Toxoplasma gondii GT1]ESS29299.1 putative transmembrane protein [Toxoplasma gondii VEG]KFG35617.1 putative transmembrane protein [Toxoplasma gondii p89]KFH14333.1 putative transmembrane protein [Toxoplasma gondii MAS]KYF39746.1 hypothetical protein TGARI_294240 [Toxoplasma gondii ARI]KYK65902.1 putative transmembrane protein [Toxoplasma gondii TgCatPRC2]PUA86856.1 putative transmembran|eukprot:XP_018638600.1 hypothetical protein TGME49_294240 [Toxoplasma gondii ME49]
MARLGGLALARAAPPRPVLCRHVLSLLTLALLSTGSAEPVLALKISSSRFRRSSEPVKTLTGATPDGDFDAPQPGRHRVPPSHGVETARLGGSRGVRENLEESVREEESRENGSDEGLEPQISEEYFRQQADLLLRCEDTGTTFPLHSAADAQTLETIQGQVKAREEEGNGESMSTPALTHLATAYYEEVAAQLRRHKRESIMHKWEAGTSKGDEVQQYVEESELCWKLHPALPSPPKTLIAKGLARMWHRLGNAFKGAFRGVKLAHTKIRNWFQKRLKRKGSGSKNASKVMEFLKRLGAVVQQKVVILAKKIIMQIVRYLPTILLAVNVFFVATSSVAVAASPAAPLAILSLVASIIGLLSFSISKGAELERRAFTQDFSSRLDSDHFQTFGLVWAKLRAEEAVQVDTTAAALTPETHGVKTDRGEASRDSRTTDPSDHQGSWTDINEAFVGAREMADGQTVVAANIDADAQWATAASVPAGEPGAVPPSQAALEEVRRKMKNNLTRQRAPEVFQTGVNEVKATWREKRFAGLGRILLTSLRTFFDLFNFAVSRLLRLFGSAWFFFVDVALRKAIAFFRMLQTFQAVAAFFEKFQSVLRWLFGRGRFFYDFVEPYRNILSFTLTNRVPMSQLANGTLMVSSSSGLVFMGTFLWAISKPLWSWYLTMQGMVDADLLERVRRQLSEDAVAYKSFLLGSEALRPKEGGDAPFVFANVSETKLVEIVFIMNFLDMYKVPNLPDASVLANTSPSQSFLLFQRIRTLDEFRGQLSPVNRALFEETFSALKTWDSTKSLHIAHTLLTRNIQHCALQYGEETFRNEIQTHYREMATKKRLNPKEFSWFVSLTTNKRQAFSSKVFDAIRMYPNSVSNPIHLRRTVKKALAAVTKRPITDKMATWAGALVHHAAVTAMGKEVILQLYKDEYQVVDRASIRVSNVPVDLHPYTEELEATLGELFVFNPSEQGQADQDSEAARERVEKFFLSEDPTGLTSVGTILGDRGQPRSVNCARVQPAVLAFADIREAAVMYRSDVHECNHAATAYFLKKQVDKQFMADVRRGLFNRKPTSCAPLRTSALEALDILADQLAMAETHELPNIALQALELIIEQHPVVASTYYRYVTQVVPEAERRTTEGVFKLIQTLRNFVREHELSRVTAAFLRQASKAHFRTNVRSTMDAPLLARVHKIVSKYRTFSTTAVEEYVYERLGGMAIDLKEDAEKAMWQGVRIHFARDFTETMQSFKDSKERVVIGMPFRQNEVRFQSFPRTIGTILHVTAFMYTQRDEDVSAAMRKVMRSILDKARMTARNLSLPNGSTAGCPICKTVQRLLEHLKNKALSIQDGHNEEETALGILSKIEEAYEKQANSLGTYFRWGEWFPERHKCLSWTEDQIRIVKLALTRAVKPLRMRRAWKGLFSRMTRQWIARKSAEKAVADDLIESISEADLYGIDGFDFRLGLRYAYKPFISANFKKEAAESWAHSEQQIINRDDNTQITTANAGVQDGVEAKTSSDGAASSVDPMKNSGSM